MTGDNALKACPSLIKQAREIAARHVTCRDFVLEGKADAWPEVKCALDGLKARSSVEDARGELVEALASCSRFIRDVRRSGHAVAACDEQIKIASAALVKSLPSLLESPLCK